ncbi:MAG: TatD family hydrolase [Acholeplasmataceae bacterium]|nr:TatD family hydrolase [Acholeplasmataceae bacterium]
MMIIDTHTHLNTDDFQNDMDAVLERAVKAGVGKIIVIGMDEASNHIAIKLAENHEMLFATVGVHPGYVEGSTTNHLESLLNHKKVVAIGECGLDFYWKTDNKELQYKVFKEQIELAVKKKLPLIIHTRDSFTEAYEMLLPYKGKVSGVFHCFSSDFKDAQKAVDLGFYIGIDGPITFKKNEVLVELVQKIDLNYILVETDSPYMAPMPYRGKRNEPSYTRYVVEKIAQIKGLSLEEVSRITTKNAHKLFHLGGHIL